MTGGGSAAGVPGARVHLHEGEGHVSLAFARLPEVLGELAGLR